MAIVGGGPNGAIAAALLARYSGIAAARIALIAPELAADAKAAATPDALTGQAPDALPAAMRVAAISRASEMVLHNADAWSRLPAGAGVRVPAHAGLA